MDAEQIKSMLNAEYGKEMEKKKQEYEDMLKNSDIVICINVEDDYDRYSAADRLEDLLDYCPYVKDMTIFTR